MFGHLYLISQQSHKSAPTGIRGICLKPIIGDGRSEPAPTDGRSISSMGIRGLSHVIKWSMMSYIRQEFDQAQQLTNYRGS